MIRKELILQFEYDKITGEFTRRFYRDRHNNLVACNYIIKGTNGHRGYKRVSINGKRYLLHKLVILYVDGYYPESEVDHIDGNTSNNKYNNLRVVDRSENRKNLKLYTNNSSGRVGVGKKENKYYAHMQYNNIRYFRGYFNNIEEAIHAREQLEIENKFHMNHGRIR